MPRSASSAKSIIIIEFFLTTPIRRIALPKHKILLSPICVKAQKNNGGGFTDAAGNSYSNCGSAFVYGVNWVYDAGPPHVILAQWRIVGMDLRHRPQHRSQNGCYRATGDGLPRLTSVPSLFDHQ